MNPSKKKKVSKPKSKSPAMKVKPAKMRRAAAASTGPVTLEQANALVQAKAPRHALRRQTGIAPAASPKSVGFERKRLEQEQLRENRRRISEYKETMGILKDRGVKGLGVPHAKDGRRRAPLVGMAPPEKRPLQIFAEGDSWFDYPVPLFGGGIIPRLEKKLGVPILNLAKAGDEVRFIMGVEERKILIKHFTQGCPAGGPWDVMLFSGGGNDIVDNPMALWVRDYAESVPASNLIHHKRYDAALGLVQAGYEDLIAMRDSLSPTTHLIFHAYDYAIPDGRGVCFLGPWMKPTFDLRQFPVDSKSRFEVVKEMLKQFADLMTSLAKQKGVTFINGQGTLAPIPKSWHNELHPSKQGFESFATLFQRKLKELFPTRVP